MVTIYNAAGLFNASDQIYNLLLTSALEKKGHKVILPQRDGFEFSKLNSALEGILEANEIPDAVNRMIYFLDKGKFIGQNSNVCVARLDGLAIDEGVVNEMGFCNMLGVPIIGLTTDIRSPYGNITNEVSGKHFFPLYSCDKFIAVSPNFKNLNGAYKQIGKVALEIGKFIRSFHYSPIFTDNLFAHNIISVAKELFGDINDIHSEDGLKEIAERYVHAKKKIENILPNIKRI